MGVLQFGNDSNKEMDWSSFAEAFIVYHFPEADEDVTLHPSSCDYFFSPGLENQILMVHIPEGNLTDLLDFQKESHHGKLHKRPLKRHFDSVYKAQRVGKMFHKSARKFASS